MISSILIADELDQWRITPIGEMRAGEELEMSDQSIRALAAKVRERRRELGLTQEEVAELGGTSAKFLIDFERGKASVRLDKLDAILDVLGLELHVRMRS